MLSFFPLDVLDEIWDVVEPVSEGFLTYSSILPFGAISLFFFFFFFFFLSLSLLFYYNIYVRRKKKYF